MIAIYKGEPDYTIAVNGRQYQTREFSFDDLFTCEAPRELLEEALSRACEVAPPIELQARSWKAPVESQEIWAAGVTYYRSRTARMEEAGQAGGDIFYDKVYNADRPEIFFKATAPRARGHLDPICIREDSSWDVPEPELTLAINSAGHIFGYTIGNDVSSRSIEGENPLYLPQAKVYRGSCAVGPALVVGDAPGPDTGIRVSIHRGGEEAFSGATELAQLKRSLEELAHFLFLENEFPRGTLLMTGTGIVPDTGFTLQSGDVVRISIDRLGTLENTVQ